MRCGARGIGRMGKSEEHASRTILIYSIVEAYYSQRSDSVGWSCAARFAGRYPNTIPVEQDTTNAITTDIHDVEK